MAVYILENDVLKATMASHGCELISVIRKADGREYIWPGKPDVWKRHAPVLFPLVGRYKNDTVLHDGREYHMTQHGFARDMEFALVAADSTEAVMRLTATPETKEKYPFDFEFICSYRLENNCLHVSWRVGNPGSETMYFSLGGHPAFVGTDKTLAGAKLEFETKQPQLQYGLLNEQGLMTADTHLLALDHRAQVVITEDFFDQDALVVENHQCHQVSLLQDDQAFVTVNFDAPVFGIWSAAHQNVPFVCIEPWYGRTDSASFEGELKDREWGNALAAGEVFDAGYQITFNLQSAFRCRPYENFPG